MQTTIATPPNPTADLATTTPLPLKVVVLGGRTGEQDRVDQEEQFVRLVSDIDDTVPEGRPASIVPYGRCSVTGRASVHLYGMPVQRRYWFMWDSLARGAVAALILVDVSRLADSFPAIDYAVARGLPHLVAVTGAAEYELVEVREALAVDDDTPVLLADLAHPRPAREVLHAVVRYAVARRNSTVPAA